MAGYPGEGAINISAAKEVEQLCRQGHSLLLQGHPNESADIYRRALHIAPDNPDALLGMGRIRQQDGRLDEAEDLYRRAADAMTTADARVMILLSSLLEQRQEFEEALEIAARCTDDFPGNDMAWRHLGNIYMHQHQMDQAWSAFARAHQLLRQPGSKFGQDRPGFRRTTRAKLRHDIEQLEYLVKHGLTNQDFGPVIADYRALLDSMPSEFDEGAVVNMPVWALERIASHYNRCHYLADAPVLEGGAINPNLDADAIYEAYVGHEPGLTWADDLLRPEALERLRSFCLQSTIWYDADHPNGYVGTYVYDGFSCPLLMQITSELPLALPQIFGDRPLTQLWAYKYDSSLSGIEMHADAAAVNVNFWLTPTTANEDPETGGLVVWDKEVPLEWHKDDYNRSDPEKKSAMIRFLKEQGAEMIRVPYQQNRAVIFNSDLLHKTDDINFKPGYENRRINVTMLYGWRE